MRDDIAVERRDELCLANLIRCERERRSRLRQLSLRRQDLRRSLIDERAFTLRRREHRKRLPMLRTRREHAQAADLDIAPIDLGERQRVLGRLQLRGAAGVGVLRVVERLARQDRR